MSIFKLIQLKPDEKIVAIYRQYGLTYLFHIVISFVLLVTPFFFLTPLFSFGIFGVFGFFVLLGVGLFYSLRKLVSWYYNMFIITSKRIVDIDQRGFFDRTVSETVYAKIQDVSYRIKGLFSTIFHYGRVNIQTAGGVANIELKRMKDPALIVDLINEFRVEMQDNSVVSKNKIVTDYINNLSEDELRLVADNLKKRFDGKDI